MTSIYQRARPRRFDEIVGQEHVKDVLLAALRHGRIGHAYLFSGPRGVGKTTTARLLAMSVNCDAASAERPCGDCESCLLVQRGEHPDVIELDAASNNSVDDVRDLREKVRLASLRGGRRVWVLDEAHMLSRAAANALLKTLEEPPPGLVFVLATTEPEKLPATVLSRCQHFRFRRLSVDEIRSKLARLAAEAGVETDDDALALVARAADGAMRDAESLLERLLVEGTRVTRDRAEAALGLPPADRLVALGRALADGAWDALLHEAGTLYRDGFAPRTVAEQLGRTLRDALVAAVTGDAPPAIALDVPALARAIETLDVASERFVRQNDLYALEVALLRVAQTIATAGPRETRPTQTVATAGAPLPQAAATDDPEVGRPAAAPGAGAESAGDRPGAAAPATAAEEPAAFDPHSRGSPAAAPTRFSWHQVMTRAGTQLKAFLLPASPDLQGTTLTLRYDERHAFHFGQLRRREAELVALLDEAGAAWVDLVIEGPGGRAHHPPRGSGGEDAPKKP